MSAVLVTGANGFVGRAVCRRLAVDGHDVTALIRRTEDVPEAARVWCHPAADFERLDAVWSSTRPIDCVVHVAARVHVMRDESTDPEAAFAATNVQGSLRVAQAALERGVRRLVYVSSIKAVGETDGGVPLSESVAPVPLDAYGRSKLAAEDAMWDLAKGRGLEVVVVRPPLVYGPGVGANFLQMMNALWRRTPLPLGALSARRSMIYVDNLADALVRCALDERAANRCFHVSDAQSLSVSELLRAIGRHLGKPARLVPVPTGLLRFVGLLTGRSAQIERLTSSLEVDASGIARVLDWHAPYSLDEGLASTAQWYRSTR